MKKYMIIISIIIVIFMSIIYIYYLKSNLYKKEELKLNQEITHIDVNSNNIAESIWCGAFQLAWNELKEYNNGNIQFVNEKDNFLLEELNNNKFSSQMLNENSYYIKVLKNNLNLKEIIYNDLKKKFNLTNSRILNNSNFNNSNGVIIYSYLCKDFHYQKNFEDSKIYFKDKNGNFTLVNGFGFNYETNKDLTDNVELLYLSENNGTYAIKIDTKENEEIIFYNTRSVMDCTLNEIFIELENNISEYTGINKLNKEDTFSVPNINCNACITYSILCDKEINGTDGEYIADAIQDINFVLNKKGGFVKSESLIVSDEFGAPPATSMRYEFDRPFVIFIREKDKDYYFAMKVDTTEFLEVIK